MKARTVRHVLQPDDSRVCGQVAVAVITGKTLEEVCVVVGHRKSTKTRDLIAALKELKRDCAGSRCIPTRSFFDEKEGTFLAQVRGTCITDVKCNWHWAAVHGGLVYDGNEEGPVPLRLYQHLPGRIITSILEVKS